MKKIATLVFVSVLGGFISLSAYKLFVENNTENTITHSEEQPNFIPTSYTHTNLNNGNTLPGFVDAADKSIHAVVHVKNTAIVSSPTTLEDFFYGRRSQRPQIGTGSGVIIDKNGYIITNNHVIDGAREISITTNDNKIYDAKLIGTDPKTDIALLKIEADEDLPYIVFGDSDQAKIGEWVLAVGNPFNLTSTVTAGIISAKSRDLSGQNYQSFIQTDAAVNPGNSGGALVNENGELVGINTAISSQTGSYIGYSFAVPSNIARKVVEDIMEFGDVQNGILGVNGWSLNGVTSEKLEVNQTEGFYVGSVDEKSGAKKAGIEKGDIITQIDNVKISKFADLTGYLNTKRPGDIVQVSFIRNSNTQIVPVELSNSEIMTLEFMDIQVKNMSQDIKDEYNIDHGVMVTKNDNYWLYQKIGLNRGYIITDINDVTINSVEDISKLKSKYGSNFSDNIEKLGIINRRGQKQSFIFR
ncbi:serine protease [Hanstruepera neustonica]|uniref:Serine protease n=1 Tax=Hanstruepera neustonica TaxID=1445657 RepID=A0A2K1DXG1_9FLAO|nr:trypsin-like peptidase domain-containing protein [Hanstruepera neustonica]PNQ72709.1 serine protease [Hanstruepera neustonica]